MAFRFSTRFLPAGAAAVLSAAVLLSPAAFASEQGGLGDQVRGNAGYTSYSAAPDTSTPCDTCYMGAGLAGTQNKSSYTLQTTPRCDTCAKGSGSY